MISIKRLVGTVLVTLLFFVAFTLPTYAAPQLLPKGSYASRLPKQAKGTWFERLKKGSYFEFKVANPKYVWVTTKDKGSARSTGLTIVTKRRHSRKNHFTLYSPAADPLSLKWSHHHIYYWGYGPNKWIKMSRYSK
ncbi:MAG: hypothetical protein ABF490_10280 [Lentilactobacillus hilgardii]|nr:hypothetical protein [Lentilactobacillus hilgardii]MBZ2202584.1 hypothetical protein [Lentilactobacillus hilgardii]MBZ2205548.1 hypothetical protein [Lentilactobacillus hilgardii]